jgi:hypothetical protein
MKKHLERDGIAVEPREGKLRNPLPHLDPGSERPYGGYGKEDQRQDRREERRCANR